MLRRPLLIATLCLLGFPAAAAARSHPDRDPLVRQWLAVARAYWGATPPCLGGVDVVVGDWGPRGDTWAYSAPGGCWIALRPSVYPMPNGVDPTWWRTAMCSTIAHEWGHVLGLPHSADPRSLMYPLVPLQAVAGCAPGARAPAVITPRHRKRRCSDRARRRAARAKRRCVRRSDRNRRAHARARRQTKP